MSHCIKGRTIWRRSRPIQVHRSQSLKSEASQLSGNEPLKSSDLTGQHFASIKSVNGRTILFIGGHVVAIRPHAVFRIVREIWCVEAIMKPAARSRIGRFRNV